MAEPTENLQIEIDGECYALNKVPDENSSVVLAAQEKLRKSVDLPALVEDLQRVGRFIRVAYNGVGAAGPKYTENQIEIQRLGYDITKLCDKSALTVARFEEATSCVLADLQSTYNYLLDDLEEMALHTLSSVSKIAEDMQKAALELKTEFEEEEKEVVKILEKTQMARKDSQLHVEEQKSKLIELEEKKRKELQLIEEYQEKEREVETRRRDLEYQEDKAVSKIGDISSVKEVVNWFTGVIPFVGKMFSTDGAEKRAEAFRKARIEALEAEQAMRNIRHEALARMASFTAKIKQCEKEQDLAKIAVDALHQAAGALKDLSVVMGKAAYFWGIMHNHCRQLAEPKVQSLVEQALKYSEDKRLKVWTSNSFKTEAIRFFARWVALKGVCGIYMKQIKLTQEELYRYIAENPTWEQSRKNLRDLAESFDSDLKRHQKALSDKDFKAQEEIKSLSRGDQ